MSCGSYISSREFHDAFIADGEEFVREYSIHGATPWEDKSRWTREMLDRGGFLHRVMRRIEKNGRDLSYRMEWYTVDALYVGGKDLYGKEKTRQYPSEVHAVIEHEFGEDLEVEM